MVIWKLHYRAPLIFLGIPAPDTSIFGANSKCNNGTSITEHCMPNIRLKLVQILVSDRESHAMLRRFFERILQVILADVLIFPALKRSAWTPVLRRKWQN